MKKQFDEVNLNKNLVHEAIKKFEKRLEDINIELKKIDTEISNCKEGKTDLEKKIEKAAEYLNKKQ